MKRTLIGILGITIIATSVFVMPTSAETLPEDTILNREAKTRTSIMARSVRSVSPEEAAGDAPDVLKKHYLQSKDYYYIDNDNALYTMDRENRLASYVASTETLNATQKTKLSKQTVINKTFTLLRESIPNFEEFEMYGSVGEDEVSYSIFLERIVDENIKDRAQIVVGKDGVLRSAFAFYCNVDAEHPITDAMKAELDAQAQTALEQKKSEDTNMVSAEISSRSYSIRDGEVVGDYSCLYSYPGPEGMEAPKSMEVMTFTLPAE